MSIRPPPRPADIQSIDGDTMRIKLADLITRAEPAVQPALTLYLALAASAALSAAAAALFSSLAKGA